MSEHKMCESSSLEGQPICGEMPVRSQQSRLQLLRKADRALTLEHQWV